MDEDTHQGDRHRHDHNHECQPHHGDSLPMAVPHAIGLRATSIYSQGFSGASRLAAKHQHCAQTSLSGVSHYGTNSQRDVLMVGH